MLDEDNLMSNGAGADLGEEDIDYLDRLVRIGDGKEAIELPLRYLLESEAVILLGDPGMGKSKAMQAVANTLNTHCRPAVTFHATRMMARSDDVIVVDGLDEIGSLRGVVTPLDEIIGALCDLGWPRFWLSCRAADWAHSSGSTMLQASSGAPQPVVAHLLPLSDQQIDTAIKRRGLDPFLVRRGMGEADLIPLLTNPQTLELTLEAFKGGGVPKSRTDLYELAISKLAEEREGRPGGARRPGKPEIVAAAGAISAVLMLSATAGIALNPGKRTNVMRFEQCYALVSRNIVIAALDSRLFRETTPEFWEPVHRTVAEYLAAKDLANRISKGEPLVRVLGLLCGGHLDPAPPLRGLFAWLAVHLPQKADLFVDRDPYGVITYGDPSRLRRTTLHALIAGLRRVAEQEPSFRGGRWHDPNFKAFSIPELVPEFRNIIGERPPNVSLLACILDALEQGQSRPELIPDLAELITDASVDPSLRQMAASVFARVASVTETTALLSILLGDDVADPDALISGRLLLSSDPATLLPADVAAFLYRYVHAPGGHSRRLHLETQIERLVLKGGEAELLDRLTRMSWSPGSTKPASRMAEIRCVARSLAAQALRDVESVTPDRLITWLPLISFNEPYLSRRRLKDDIRDAFEARPDLYIPVLLQVWRARQAHPHAARYTLERELPGLRPPSDIVERALAGVASAPEDDGAAALYLIAMGGAVAEGDLDSEVFRRAWYLAEQHENLKTHRKFATSCGIDHLDITRDSERLVRDGESKKRSLREAFAQKVTRRIEKIRRGETKDGWLGRLAEMWFGHECENFTNTLDMAPRERLSAILRPEVVELVEQGFRQHAEKGPIIGVDDLIVQAGQNVVRTSDIAALAGADLLFKISPEKLGAFEEARCVGLFCASLVHFTHFGDSNFDEVNRLDWTSRVIVEHEEACLQALTQLFVKQFDTLPSHRISGLHEMLGDRRLEGIRSKLLPVLLGAAPAPGVLFDVLVRAAALSCARDAFEVAVRRRLEAAGGDDRWPWLHLAWRFRPAEHEAEFLSFSAGHLDRVSDVLSWLPGTSPMQSGLPITPVSLIHRSAAIRLAGRLFSPVSAPDGGGDAAAGFEKAHALATQIHAVGETPGVASEAALMSFVEDERLSAYKYVSQAALSAWRRNMRMDSWQPPPAQDVVEALIGGTPASPADLQGFVVDHLEEIGLELRAGPTSPYRAFWNIEKGELKGPREENLCRDVIAERLDACLKLRGLSQGTEVRHIEDTRCDIEVSKLGLAMPVEVKCDWNEHLWSAWKDQLDESYACAPTARGFGVYLVVWFGDAGEKGDTDRRVRPNPTTGVAPATAVECLDMLRADMKDVAYRLTPVVLDVSPPGRGALMKPAIARTKKGMLNPPTRKTRTSKK